MHRLFVAIVPPAVIRDRLLASMGGVAGARWQSDAQLHLTLRYIGEVDRLAAADIIAALGRVRSAPFELALGSPGPFERRGFMNALWVGVTPQAAISALATAVDRALQQAGVPPEARDFLPHITVARFGQVSGPLRDYFSRTYSNNSRFLVDAFTLFESLPGKDGSEYRAIETYRLA